mgnify:CR=1 FL=1
MNIDEKIEDLREEFENKIKELKEEYELEKSGKWIPDYEEKYYYLSSCFEVFEDINSENIFSKKRIKYNKIFETRAEAQEYASYLKAKKEYSYEFSEEEWKNTNIIYKHYIYYDFNDKAFYIGSAEYCGRIGTIYFKTYEKAQAFIDKYKKQILKFEFGIEEE